MIGINSGFLGEPVGMSLRNELLLFIPVRSWQMLYWAQDRDDFAVQCRGLVNWKFFAVEMKELCVQEQVRAGKCSEPGRTWSGRVWR